MKKIKSIGLLFLELVLIYHIFSILEFGFYTPKIGHVIISFLICMGLIPLLVHGVKKIEREEEENQIKEEEEEEKEKLIKLSHETCRLLIKANKTLFDTDINIAITNIERINIQLHTIHKIKD